MNRPSRLSRPVSVLIGVCALLLTGLAALLRVPAPATTPQPDAPPSASAPTSAAPKPATQGKAGATTSGFGDERTVRQAFRDRKSGVLVEVSARVKRLLPDDTDGSEHQRFILDLDGLTVLVAHNTDLAPRVPLKPGDSVQVRGQYEFNEQGGVIHWTHHDPGKRRPGGWIKHADKAYE